jgi:hypothetical protein
VEKARKKKQKLGKVSIEPKPDAEAEQAGQSLRVPKNESRIPTESNCTLNATVKLIDIFWSACLCFISSGRRAVKVRPTITFISQQSVRTQSAINHRHYTENTLYRWLSILILDQ